MKKLMSKKSVKNAILIISVALLLVAVTLGWFAKNVFASVKNINASIRNEQIQYQLFDGEGKPLEDDEVKIVPGNEYVYRLDVTNAPDKVFNVGLHLTFDSSESESSDYDVRDYLQCLVRDSGSGDAWKTVPFSDEIMYLIEDCADLKKSIEFKFSFPGEDKGDEHNMMSKQKLTMNLLVEEEKDTTT